MFKTTWKLLKQTYNSWSEDKAMRLGAALAYYSVFSIAPLVLITIAVASMFLGEEAAQGQIVEEISGTVGTPVAQALEDQLQANQEKGTGGLATLTGIVVLLFGASGVFAQLQDALNTVWKVAPRPDRGILGMIRDRFLSMTMVLGTGFLLLVSLVITAALAALARFWTPAALPGGAYLWQALHGLVSLAFITVLFALMYKYLPDARIEWRDVWIGAAITAVLFTIGKYLLGLYLGQASVASTYGAAGSLVVILLWVYYSALILLFGAEFTRVYAEHLGKGIEPAANAVAVTHEDRLREGMPREEDLHEAANERQRPAMAGR